MSARRLADKSLQPSHFSFTKENADWCRQVIARYPEGRQQSAILPILMRVQEQEGWISRIALEIVAKMLSMPFIRALEVVTFYTQFQLQPVGSRAHIHICGTTPCMLRGSENLLEICRRRIHPDPQKLNPSGTLSWEEVECLGACVNAPVVMIAKDTFEDLTSEQFEKIISSYENGEETALCPGPQNGRHSSEPFDCSTEIKIVDKGIDDVV